MEMIIQLNRADYLYIGGFVLRIDATTMWMMDTLVPLYNILLIR